MATATAAAAAAPSASSVCGVSGNLNKAQIAAVADACRSKWGAGPLQNISLDLLGIAPWNRGRLGVSVYHVFDVVASVKEDGLSRQRYRDVCVIRVPDCELDNFLKFNKDVLAACPDLPPFSPKMRYACLTKHLGRSLLRRLMLPPTFYPRCLSGLQYFVQQLAV